MRRSASDKMTRMAKMRINWLIAKSFQDILSNPIINLLERSDQVAEEVKGVVVTLVESQQACKIGSRAGESPWLTAPRLANHPLRSVVLPKPAASEMRISLCFRRRPSFSRRSKCEHDTRPDRDSTLSLLHHRCRNQRMEATNMLTCVLQS
jgi:hypothetical protein